MENMELTLTIEGDSDGYVSFECPYCEMQFKLKISEYEEESSLKDLHCPYCGLSHEKDHFFTKEVIEEAEARVYNELIEQLSSSLKKMSKTINKSKVMKMSVKTPKKMNTKELAEVDSDEVICECPKCSKHEKLINQANKIKAFCAYCGEWM